jgi:hypothetical protein
MIARKVVEIIFVSNKTLVRMQLIEEFLSNFHTLFLLALLWAARTRCVSADSGLVSDEAAVLGEKIK